MREYQLKFDIFNVKLPIIEEQINYEVKQDNKAKVVINKGFATDIIVKEKEEDKRNMKEEIKEIEF